MLILMTLLGCGEPPEQALETYYAELDDSCSTDDDCAVLDEHNCCGYYPACLNRDAAVDATFVSETCADGGLGGVCGWEDIETCTCVSNICEANAE